MASMPLALSVHKLISSVGADAGFASVIGLAILALLYFAHARETANLREDAAVLAQRLQEAEARLDAAQRVAPAGEAGVVAAPISVDARAGAGQKGAAPAFAPAGVAAPALASATRLVPALGAPTGAVVEPAVVAAAASIKVSRAAGAVPPSAGADAPSTSGAAVELTRPAPEAAPAPAEPAAPQATPVPAGPASPVPPQPPVRPPAPAPAAVTAFRTAPATVAGAAGPRTAEDGTNGSPSGPVQVTDSPSVRSSPPAPVRQAPFVPSERSMFVSARERPGSPVGRRLAVLLGLLVVAGAVAAVVIATSGTGTQSGAGASGGGNPSPVLRSAFDPARVTVAVLNGTNTNQLAHHVADRLVARGYQQGLIATASNQTMTSTIVGYLPGTANRTDALHVAKALGLPARAVTPADQAAQGVACPPPSACSANVIVTVGANLATGY